MVGILTGDRIRWRRFRRNRGGRIGSLSRIGRCSSICIIRGRCCWRCICIGGGCCCGYGADAVAQLLLACLQADGGSIPANAMAK